MPVSSDILIDYTNKRIYQEHAYVASTDTVYSAQQLYTHLMNTFDDQAQMDNPIPISAQTPNAFTMTNGWFIDDETVKWFKDGAIATENWTHPINPQGIRMLTCDTLTGVTSADIGVTVQGDTTSDTGKLLAFDATRKTMWIRSTGSSDLFDNASEGILVDSVSCGALTKVSDTGENLYVNVYTLGTLTSSSDTIYVIQADDKLSAWWNTGIDAFDVLVKVKEMGTPIVSGDVTVFCRYYPADGDAALYDHFPIKLTAGRQAVPLATALDLNNTSSQALVEDYLDGTLYTVSFGFAGYEKTLGGVTASYDVSINCDGARVSELYEALKYVCRETSTVQLGGDNGEEYIAAQTAYAPVKASPFGTFAGGKFFGARGVWIENYNALDAQNFQLISASNATVTPPNTVICRVTAIASGDSVAMFMTNDGGIIEKNTYTIADPAASTASVIVVNEAITNNWSGQDPPEAGYLRVVKAAGDEILAQYSGWDISTFTLIGILGDTCASSDTVYVPIIDAAASTTFIQNSLVKSLTSTVNILSVVRNYAGSTDSIIPWSQQTTIADTGVIVNAARTKDGIVL